MDVNGTRFRLILDREEFGPVPDGLEFCPESGWLRLAIAQRLRIPRRDVAASWAAWRTAPAAVLDRFDQVATISEDGAQILVRTASGVVALADDQSQPFTPPLGSIFVDMCLGGDARLAAIISDNENSHVLFLFHLRLRWHMSCALETPGSVPRRVWVDRESRVWIASDGSLIRASGSPLPQDYVSRVGKFYPKAVNPHPLQVDFAIQLPDNLRVIGLAGDLQSVVILAAQADDAQVLLVRPIGASSDALFSVVAIPTSLPFFTDLALIAPARVALIAPISSSDAAASLHDVVVVELQADPPSQPMRIVQQRWPLRRLSAPRFVSCLDGVVRYQSADGPTRLSHLPLAQYRTDAEITVGRRQATDTPALLDSGIVGCVWHRLYAEASIPHGCQIVIKVRAGDTPDAVQATEWQEQPSLVWRSLPSEIPWHDGFLPRVSGESGLFETLIQQGSGNVRRVAGRYLQVKLEFRGDGRNTPILACLRLHFQRFCIQENYLPSHFHQQEERRNEAAPANGSDVRERYFANFEGLLTELEGRIANAEVMLDPFSTPRRLLPLLAKFTATAPDPDWSEPKQRRWIASAGLLQNWHGTARGVRLGLDIATGGAVVAGQVVVIENWRLRRTMGTLLGIDREDEQHPMTLGSMVSGNSIVGDSLILSETAARAYLALLDPSLETASVNVAVDHFFEKYAHTLTILLHGPAKGHASTISRVLPRLLPAHLRWQLLEPEPAFVLGLSPLLAIDSYLEYQPVPREVVLGDTWLGYEGVLANPEALIPHAVSDAVSLP